jgi:glycosyltransferase involved in cell wall biosynthesis
LESIITYNGKIFCVSQRIYDALKKLSKNARLLLPPVDDDFFRNINLKDENKKIRIGYMGRLDYGKGADLAYNYFLNSKLDRNKYEFYIYSYPWKNDKFSIDLHNELKSQNKVTYIETKLFDNPVEVDKFLAGVIDETDIFFLPYRFMRSTIDAPLVPMEVMARNKPFISTNLQAMQDINYTDNNLLELEMLESVETIDDRILKNLNNISLIQRNLDRLGYSTSKISQKLLEELDKKND